MANTHVDVAEVIKMVIPKNVINMVERKLKRLPKVIKGLKRSMQKKIKLKRNTIVKPDNTNMNMGEMME